jgi:hypothetical protein
LISGRNGVGRIVIVIAIIAILALSITGIILLTLPNQAPDPPDYLGADTHENKVMLTWSSANGNGLDVTSYKIYRGTSPGEESLLIHLGTVLVYNDTSVSSGHTYYYTVSAVNSVGEGPTSHEISVTMAAVPTAPRDLSTNIYAYEATLTWTAPANDGGATIIGYKVFRSATSGTYGDTPFAIVSSLYFIDNLAGMQGERFYVVKAYNYMGDSPASNEVTVSGGLETPTITMTYQKIGSGSYRFTVVGVTANDVPWADIEGILNPPIASPGELAIPTTGYVGAGDVVTLVNGIPGTTYSITLKYTLTGSAAYTISLYVN